MNLVWRCTSCGECRHFERPVGPKSVSHGKRLLGHCRECGELRILRFEGLRASEPTGHDRPTRRPALPRSA